jgi:hypothetical protein
VMELSGEFMEVITSAIVSELRCDTEYFCCRGFHAA